MPPKAGTNEALLQRAADDLRSHGHHEVARALLRSSATIKQVDSWWDGHDDYIYDVHLTIAAPANCHQVLAQADQAVCALVRSSLARSLSFFDGRRYDLVELSLAPVEAPAQRDAGA